MKTIVLKPEFILSPEDLQFLQELPDNMPDTKLKVSQIEQIKSIYYKYISKNQVFYGWGGELFELEQKEKWTGGRKVKMHEAMRIVLSGLVLFNTYKQNLDTEQALDFVFHNLTCRESRQILLYKAFHIK